MYNLLHPTWFYFLSKVKPKETVQKYQVLVGFTLIGPALSRKLKWLERD